MKKAFIIILALAMCLSMAACSGGGSGDTGKTAGDSSATEDSVDGDKEDVSPTPEEVLLAEKFPQWHASFQNGEGKVVLTPKSETEVSYSITLSSGDTITGTAKKESDTLASNDDVIIELVGDNVQITVNPEKKGEAPEEESFQKQV